MPELKTPDGKAVPVAPIDEDAVNRAFDAAMNDDGPDEQAPPKRAPKAAPDEPKPRRTRQPKAEKARTTSKPAAALTREQRTEGIKGLFQIGAGLAMIAGKSTGSDAFQADAVTIASAAEDGAGILADMADADPGFAARLDKVCSVGPYGALIAFGVGLGTQLMRNHRPGMQLPGTVHPDELLKSAAPAAAA